MENQQLIKKDRSANSYSKIFPWTFTDLVLDRVTKESLDNILVRNNFIALPYVGSKAATRLQVPMKNRRRGIWLSYIDYAGTLTVEYYNDNNLDDNHWQDSSYWLPYNTAEFQPASVGLSALAQEVFDWINSQITAAVKLNPEDLQKSSSGQIEEANRAYDTSTFSGLGYRILRKNIQSNKNILTQSMINMPNNVYKIRYDFDLNGATINLPANSVLQFVGGSIKNGTLNGNNTVIEADSNAVIFDSVVIEGTWNNDSVYDIWFSHTPDSVNGNNTTIQNFINLTNSSTHTTVHLSKDRKYWVKRPEVGPYNPDYGTDWYLGYDDPNNFIFFLKSNSTWIIDSDIELIAHSYKWAFMFYLLEVDNITVEGCGNIIGDNAGHVPYNPEVDGYGEWGFGIVVRKCNNIIIRNLTLSRQWGDGLIVKGVPADTYVNTNILVDNVTIYKNRRNGVAIGAVTGCSILNCLFDGNGTDEVRGTLPKAGIDFEADNIDSFVKGNINVVMDNCKFQNNFYSISSTVSQLKDYGKAGTIISNCIFDASLRLNEMHWITFENCYIPSITTTWTSTWGNSNGIIFNNCIFGEIDPYQVASAFEYGNAFNNCILPQANEIKRQLYVNLGVGRTIKLTLPNLNGNVSFSAYTYGAGASSATPVYAKWNFFFGNSVTRRLKNVEAIIPNTSTLAAATYKWLPVFSNLYYNSATSRYELYFTIGGNVDTPSTPTTSSVTGVIHIEGDGRFVNTSMSWLDVTKEYIDTTSIPSYVTWPKKEIFGNSYDGDLPVLDVTEVGRRVYSLSSKKPLYWDNTTTQFRDSDGYPNLAHIGFESNMTTVAASLTTSDRGYRFFLRNTQSVLYWDGTEFVNEDGTPYSSTRIIKGKDTSLTWNQVLGFQDKRYIIVGDIDLEGETLTLGYNSTLDFQGGSIYNGTIVFQNTSIKGDAKLFVSASGTIANTSISLNWFGLSPDADDNSVLFSRIQNLNCSYRELTLEHGNYNFSQTIVFEQSNVTFRGISGRTFGGSDVTLVITVDDVLLRLKGTRYQIKDITFAGSVDARTASVGLMFSRVDNPDSTTESALASIDSKVENCQFYNLWRGIYVLGNQIRLSDLSFSRCMQGMAFDTFAGASPMYYGSNGRSYVISRCNFHSMVSTDLANGCIVILNRDCICFQISGCHQDCETHFIVGQALTRSTIEDNMIANVTQGGIRVSRIYNSIITGNSFLSSLGTDNPVINDSPSNRLRQGIYATVDAFSSIISNNYFDYCNMEHIRLEKSLNITITGNTFRRWGQSITEANKCALWLPGSTTRVTVTANTFEQDIQANSYLAYIQDGSKSVFADNIINTKNGAKIVRYTVGETVQACFNVDNNVTSDIIVPTSDNISSIDSVTNKEGFFYVYNNSGGGLPLGIISADITVRRITIDKLLKVLIPFDLSYGVWTQVVDLTNSTITKWTPMNKALTRPVSNYSNFDSTDTGALHWDGTSLKLWNGTSWTNV